MSTKSNIKSNFKWFALLATAYCLIPLGIQAQAPTVNTLAATAINSSGATLNASVNPNGASTDVSFQYSANPALGCVVTTLAGAAGASGSADGLGAAARFNLPYGAAVDAAGNVYVADWGNHTVRKITPAGLVSTLAGSAGQAGTTDGAGSAARFRNPTYLALDAAGNIFASDSGNQTVRKITPAGVVTTYAGSPGSSGSSDGTGSAARFNNPLGLAVDSAGNIFVADSVNNTIRKITPAQVVSTFAGAAGLIGSSNGTGSAARFSRPNGLAIDALGNLYVGDINNYTVRKITPAAVVTTLAGQAGSNGYVDGTDGAARFASPAGVAVDSFGNLYVVDHGNQTIRYITSAGMVTTVAGTHGISGSADGTGPAAQFSGPYSVAVSPTGDVFVPDYGNYTIRRLGPPPSVLAQSGLTGSSAVSVSLPVTGLQSVSTYYFRAMASNSSGIVIGSILNFTTLSANANLSTLLLSAGTLSPAFNSNITAYSANLSDTITTLILTPTKAQANATIRVRVNGGSYSVVASGSPSAPLPLHPGTNSIDLQVTAQDPAIVKTYTLTVNVADMTPPSITCPSDVTVNNDPGLCTASGVALGTPTVSDNSGAATVINNAPTQFPLGVTVVTWTAYDASGNTNTCAQRVLVQEAQPPILDCAPDKTVECGSAWSFDEPSVRNERVFDSMVYDNSINDLVIRFDPGTAEVGDEIILGGAARYLKTFTLEYWGVNLLGGSSFEGSVTARLRFYANNGPAFNGYPTPGIVLFDSGDFAVAPTTRSTLEFDDFVTGAATPLTQALPNSFTWSIQFNGLGANDRAGVDLYSPPVIGHDYPDYWDRTGNGWELRTNSMAAMDFAALAYASHIDGRTEVRVVSTVTNATVPGDSYTVSRTWQVTDPCGGTATCSQLVTVRDTLPPVVTLDGGASLTVECHASFTDPGANADDDCAGSLPVSVDGSVDVNTVGDYTLTYTATDPSGNVGTATRTVNVVDTTPPSITCPADIAVNTDPGQCTASGVVLGAPTVTDNSGAATVINNAPAQFPVGVTVVTWTAYDASGNTNTCTQRVTVHDTSLPSITCPANIITNTVSGQCNQLVSFAPTATDLCGAVTVVCTPASGSAFPKGAASVTCVATDGAGNSSSCSFTVTVNDSVPPVVTCLGNITTNTTGSCSQIVNYITNAVDNCSLASVTCTPPSGSSFPLGDTTVTCVAQDASDNTSSCSFTVTVNDTELPAIACPANVVTNTTGGCTQVVNFTPVATDNCALANVVCSPASGTTFPVGTTAVECTATDQMGNHAQCSFSVTVQQAPVPLTYERQGEDLIITWPLACSAFVLEQTTSLTPPTSWGPAEGEFEVVGDLYKFTTPIKMTEPRRFFRVLVR